MAIAAPISTPSIGNLPPVGFRPLPRLAETSPYANDTDQQTGRLGQGLGQGPAQTSDGAAPASGFRPGGLGGALLDTGTALGAQEQAADPVQGDEGDGEDGVTAGPTTSPTDLARTAEGEDAEDEDGDGLTEEEEEQVADLKQRDAEVRRHEQAHAAAGGQYAGAPTYSYQRGPDGQQYAVGGEVSIDTSPVSGDPEATIRKADVIKRAALAPAEPSSADRQVAAKADAMRQQAQAELTQQRAEEAEGGGEGDAVGETGEPNSVGAIGSGGDQDQNGAGDGGGPFSITAPGAGDATPFTPSGGGATSFTPGGRSPIGQPQIISIAV